MVLEGVVSGAEEGAGGGMAKCAEVDVVSGGVVLSPHPVQRLLCEGPEEEVVDMCAVGVGAEMEALLVSRRQERSGY